MIRIFKSDEKHTKKKRGCLIRFAYFILIVIIGFLILPKIKKSISNTDKEGFYIIITPDDTVILNNGVYEKQESHSSDTKSIWLKK
jgi:hypothetical protein